VPPPAVPAPEGRPGPDPGPAPTAAQASAVTPGIFHTPAPVGGPGPNTAAPGVSFASGTSNTRVSASGPPGSDRWYAVVVGRNPSDAGVHQDFVVVAPMVVGVSGAVFRGPFKTKVEAESYLASVMHGYPSGDDPDSEAEMVCGVGRARTK
jgi:hypothetical protein